MHFTITKNTDLDVYGRIGTKDILRGSVFLNRQIPFPGPIHGGQLSLIASSQELIENPLYNGNHPGQLLQNLSVSREPAVQFTTYPIAFHGFSLNLGTGWGRYRELPSNVTADRLRPGVSSTRQPSAWGSSSSHTEGSPRVMHCILVALTRRRKRQSAFEPRKMRHIS